MPIHIPKKARAFFDLLFSQTVLSFLLLMKTNHRNRLSFIWWSLYFNYILTWITENEQVHCIHQHLLKGLCFPDWQHFVSFLVRVKKLLISKSKIYTILILLLLVQLVSQQVHCFHYHLLKSPCFPDWRNILLLF